MKLLRFFAISVLSFYTGYLIGFAGHHPLALLAMSILFYLAILTEDDFLTLERKRMKWSRATFPESTALSSLSKAKGELDEIQDNILAGTKDPTEYADAIMCLFDSAARDGIPAEEVIKAYANKLNINKARKWVINSDNSYSHLKME
ncbi:dATP/dGTP pyrophosphohydrolase domain-containing protein [Foetidibacter luteolus]|uniref:dATP/dGTP pyrophosphohydrolase domain-containing protein n=1 Tax=Foetidibacter luteolus TaxID=2608880 RepID=UPI00129A4D2C|nr:dATP/dGTP pyrophosphohydrolase domain-containing protein [Foetidibacter luteolus]